MKAFRSSALFVVLALAVVSGSSAARADRDDHHNDHRSDFSGRVSPAEPRGNSRGFSFRQTDSRGELREDWRSRGSFNNGRDHDDDHNTDSRGNDRRYESGARNPYGQGIYNQRLYDDRRGNTGYDRRNRPVNDVIREVQDRYGGQVIGVQDSEGGSMYRVRVLQRDGRVKTVLVPSE